MKRVLITGATSGIGRELAVQLVGKGYKVGLTGRRTERLQELKEQLGELVYYRTLDVRNTTEATKVYQELIEEMGGMDIIILNAGVGRHKLLAAWESDEKTLEVNIMAFAHGCHFAFDYFNRQGHGHIVGMSSIASLVASAGSAAYTASKHFVSNYLTGFRQKAKRVSADIIVTEIKPGFVKSEMTENNSKMFWVSSTEKAVQQMVRAIEKKRNHVYVTKRWRLLAWVAKSVPQFVWDRL